MTKRMLINPESPEELQNPPAFDPSAALYKSSLFERFGDKPEEFSVGLKENRETPRLREKEVGPR